MRTGTVCRHGDGCVPKANSHASIASSILAFLKPRPLEAAEASASRVVLSNQCHVSGEFVLHFEEGMSINSPYFDLALLSKSLIEPDVQSSLGLLRNALEDAPLVTDHELHLVGPHFDRKGPPLREVRRRRIPFIRGGQRRPNDLAFPRVHHIVHRVEQRGVHPDTRSAPRSIRNLLLNDGHRMRVLVMWTCFLKIEFFKFFLYKTFLIVFSALFFFNKVSI